MRTVQWLTRERTLLFCTAVGALLLAGCASTIQYPPFPDQTKTVENPAKARIYLIRKEKIFGYGVGIEFYGSTSEVAVGPRVGAGGMRLVGQVGPGSYLCWEESPHPFVFQRIERDTNSITSLPLSAGSVYYLRAYLHSGWIKTTSRIDILNEKDGQAMLKKCQPPDEFRKTK